MPEAAAIVGAGKRRGRAEEAGDGGLAGEDGAAEGMELVRIMRRGQYRDERDKKDGDGGASGDGDVFERFHKKAGE